MEKKKLRTEQKEEIESKGYGEGAKGNRIVSVGVFAASVNVDVRMRERSASFLLRSTHLFIKSFKISPAFPLWTSLSW